MSIFMATNKRSQAASLECARLSAPSLFVEPALKASWAVCERGRCYSWLCLCSDMEFEPGDADVGDYNHIELVFRHNIYLADKHDYQRSGINSGQVFRLESRGRFAAVKGSRDPQAWLESRVQSCARPLEIWVCQALHFSVCRGRLGPAEQCRRACGVGMVVVDCWWNSRVAVRVLMMAPCSCLVM